jgi:hypothetical protein
MEIEVLALLLCLLLSSLSLLCCFLTLLLLFSLSNSSHDHRQYRSTGLRGYHSLVLSLTLCQIIYNISFYFLLYYDSIPGRILYGVLNIWGGISSSLWSNILIFVVYQIVSTLQSVNIKDNYYSYRLFASVPATLLSILEAIFVQHQGSTAIFYIYFAIRSISVLGNLILFGIIFYHFYRLNALSNDEYYKLNSTNPIYVLAMRLIYYCLVQTVTRLGASWYQLQYGYGHNFHHESASLTQTIAYLLEFILTPAAGIGYLIVFLAIQPEAQRILWRWCDCWKNSRQSKEGRMSSQNEELTVGLTVGGEESEEKRSEDRHLFLPSTSSNSGPHYSNHSNSSLFPLLEMDEDDLAKEIDRLYYFTSEHSAHLLPPPIRRR